MEMTKSSYVDEVREIVANNEISGRYPTEGLEHVYPDVFIERYKQFFVSYDNFTDTLFSDNILLRDTIGDKFGLEWLFKMVAFNDVQAIKYFKLAYPDILEDGLKIFNNSLILSTGNFELIHLLNPSQPNAYDLLSILELMIREFMVYKTFKDKKYLNLFNNHVLICNWIITNFLRTELSICPNDEAKDCEDMIECLICFLNDKLLYDSFFNWLFREKIGLPAELFSSLYEMIYEKRETQTNDFEKLMFYTLALNEYDVESFKKIMPYPEVQQIASKNLISLIDRAIYINHIDILKYLDEIFDLNQIYESIINNFLGTIKINIFSVDYLCQVDYETLEYVFSNRGKCLIDYVKLLKYMVHAINEIEIDYDYMSWKSESKCRIKQKKLRDERIHEHTRKIISHVDSNYFKYKFKAYLLTSQLCHFSITFDRLYDMINERTSEKASEKRYFEYVDDMLEVLSNIEAFDSEVNDDWNNERNNTEPKIKQYRLFNRALYDINEYIESHSVDIIPIYESKFKNIDDNEKSNRQIIKCFLSPLIEN